jgi:hypothetical protein
MEISGKTLFEIELCLSIVGRGVLARDVTSIDQDLYMPLPAPDRAAVAVLRAPKAPSDYVPLLGLRPWKLCMACVRGVMIDMAVFQERSAAVKNVACLHA